MGRGLLILVSVAALSAVQAQPKAGNATVNELAVQAALRQGRALLAQGMPRQAIETLEARLAQINGNTDYLTVLRDAYLAQIRELQNKQRDEQIPEFAEKLKAIEAALAVDSPAASGSEPVKARAKSDPFQQTPLLGSQAPASEMVRRAEAAFGQKKYAEAADLYRQAHAGDPKLVTSVRGNWAYCRLFQVVEQLKKETLDAGTCQALEAEVQAALALADDKPELQKFGRTVQERVRERAGVVPAGLNMPGWAVEEGTNFRVLHKQSADLARKVAQQAEKARTSAAEKWFGSPSASAWSPKCDIVLHATGAEYARATGKDFRAPGHTTLEAVDRKLTKRRIDLVADNPQILAAAVPHEVTHVVIADLFPDPMLPRWADEAMAILAEPRENVDRYVRALAKVRREGRLYPVGQLLTLKEFPDAGAITAFYVQSVSLVDMLVAERGPQTFCLFLQAAQRYGVEKGLERSYGIRSFSELQQRWQRQAFSQPD